MIKYSPFRRELLYGSCFLKSIIRASYIFVALIASSCELYEKLLPKHEQGQLNMVFEYSDNYSSYGMDLISTADGFVLLTDERHSPSGNSVIKLDHNFNLVWKITVGYASLRKIFELPNGKILGVAGMSLMTIEPDGSSWSWVNEIRGQNLFALVSGGKLYVYGSDINYKSFLSRYDFDFKLLWTKRTPWNNILTLGTNSIQAVNFTGDTLRRYTFDGELMEQFAVNAEKIFVIDFQVDYLGNRYVFGISNAPVCCCNDKMRLTKISTTGEVSWQMTIGNSGSNNNAVGILVKENAVYLSGGWGEDNCIGGDFDGNSMLGFFVRYDLNGNLERVYRSELGMSGLFLGRAISDGDDIYLTGAITTNDVTRASIFKVIW